MRNVEQRRVSTPKLERKQRAAAHTCGTQLSGYFCGDSAISCDFRAGAYRLDGYDLLRVEVHAVGFVHFLPRFTSTLAVCLVSVFVWLTM